MTIHNHPIPIRDHAPEVIGSYWQLLAEADDYGVWSDPADTSTLSRWRDLCRSEGVSAPKLIGGALLTLSTLAAICMIGLAL